MGIVPLSAAGFGPIDTPGIAVSPSGRVHIVDRPRDRIVEAPLEPALWSAEAGTPRRVAQHLSSD